MFLNHAAFTFRCTVLGLIAVALLLVQPTAGKTLSDGSISVTGVEIQIDGVITQAVTDRFIQQVRSNSNLEVVSLNSPGGSVFSALSIARTVNKAGLNTTISSGDECYSACSFIFLAGKVRVADGLLGVHQVSGVDDPSLTQSTIGQIYEALLDFNTPSYLVARMLRTPPGDMYVFSPEELEQYSINIRDSERQADQVAHLLPLETWMHQDWLVGVFMNTHINKPFIALESRDMDVQMRIVSYPDRFNMFVEFMHVGWSFSRTMSQLELRFGRGADEPFSIFVNADVEQQGYAFDMPSDPQQAAVFWSAFTTGTDLTVLNGSGVEIGRFSLYGSYRASEDFVTLHSRF